MNWTSWLFLLASLWGAWFAYNALVPRRRGVYLSTWSFVAGWFTGEFPLHHIAWQALATGAFAWTRSDAPPRLRWGGVGAALLVWLALPFVSGVSLPVDGGRIRAI